MFLERKEGRWVLERIHRGRIIETTLAYTASKVWLRIGTVSVAVHSGCIWLLDEDVKEIRYVMNRGRLEVEVLLDGI